MSTVAKRYYQFGQFRIDAEKRVLLREGEIEPLAPKAFDMLLVLVQHHGEVLEKGELMEMLWPDSDVEEANLPQNISALRKALGESPNERRYIITVPGRGYRFAAEVEELDGEGQDLIVERYAKSTVVIQEQEASQGDASRSLPALRVLSGHRKMVLAGLISLAFITILATGLWAWLSRKPAGQLPHRSIESLAVLPFRPLGAEGGDEYMGLGIADSLITRLSNLREIKVRPTSSILKYNNQSKDPGQIGRELGVEAVLEGSIRRDGETLRVTVQLVRVEDGSPLWAEKFDDRFTSIFNIEDSMSERVAESLVPRLSGKERAALGKRYTDNPEAYNEYLKGRLFWNRRTVDGMKKAIEHFEQAIAQDPNYALAHVGLADSYVLLEEYAGTPASETLPKARAAVQRALQIDDSLTEAHASLGFIEMSSWNFSEAEREYKRAIELNPNYPTVRQWYSIYLRETRGRFDEAMEEIKRAQQLDPLSPVISANVALVHLAKGELDAAIEECKKIIELEPNFPPGHCFLSLAYQRQGRYEHAIAGFRRAVELSGRAGMYLSELGQCYAVAGKRAEARVILKELEKKYAKGESNGLYLASVWAGLGEKDQAFAWLEKDFQARNGLLPRIAYTPVFVTLCDLLRSDPRWGDLLRRIGLTQN